MSHSRAPHCLLNRDPLQAAGSATSKTRKIRLSKRSLWSRFQIQEHLCDVAESCNTSCWRSEIDRSGESASLARYPIVQPCNVQVGHCSHCTLPAMAFRYSLVRLAFMSPRNVVYVSHQELRMILVNHLYHLLAFRFWEPAVAFGRDWQNCQSCVSFGLRGTGTCSGVFFAACHDNDHASITSMLADSKLRYY